MTEFLEFLKGALDANQPLKITISKPRSKSDDLRNVFIRPIILDGDHAYQATYRYKTNDQVKNYSPAALPSVVEGMLEVQFLLADLYLSDKKVVLLQSKKGSIKVLVKAEATDIKIESHNHQKERTIAESAPYLKDLGLSSQQGLIYAKAQAKYKQINRYVELISGLIKDEKSVNTVIDMGSGKGYLTFALYDYLTLHSDQSLSVKGVELRKDLVEKCSTIAKKNHLSGLSFSLGSIEDYPISHADMVIALHACDIATDMAIAKGLEADATYIVVAPCCHKQIRKAMTPTDSVLNPILSYGILKERTAEMVTDTIRALILESRGYETKVFEFISSAHTGKNVMITAQKTGRINKNALLQIAALKSEFGIDMHYLERILN